MFTVQICLNKLHPSINAPCAFPNDFTLCYDQSHHVHPSTSYDSRIEFSTHHKNPANPRPDWESWCCWTYSVPDVASSWRLLWLISSRFFTIRKLPTTSLIPSLSAFPPRAPQTFYIYLFLILTFIVVPNPKLDRIRVLSSTYFRSLRQTSLQCYLRKTDLTPSFLRRRLDCQGLTCPFPRRM